MTDQSPEIVFEEPPPKAHRSTHFPLLWKLKENPPPPGIFARVKDDLTEKDSINLANQLRHAAAKIGAGFEVVQRFIPATGNFGVWVTYKQVAGDQPPEEQAAVLVAEHMAVPEDAPRLAEGLGVPPVDARSNIVEGDGSGTALPPVDPAAEAFARLSEAEGTPPIQHPLGARIEV